MIFSKKIYALIPSKLTSITIKKKNLKKIKNKSLLNITIDQTKKSKYIDEIHVSSENESLRKNCINKKINFFKRNKKNSIASATANDVIKEFILKKKLNINDILIYLQPTSPLRKYYHIDKSLKLFIKNKNLTLIGLKKVKFPIFKLVKKKKNYFSAFFKDSYLTKNRQNFPPMFIPNGAIYVFLVKNFIKKNHSIPTSKFNGYIMSDIESLDIDNIIDLKLAKKYFK